MIKFNQQSPEYENNPPHVQGTTEACNASKLGDTARLQGSMAQIVCHDILSSVSTHLEAGAVVNHVG